MSIIVQGMNMPTRCWDCPMCYDMIGCSLTGERWWSDSHVYLDFSPGEERMFNCPLVELPPHGRLGDLDEMAVDESEAYMSAQLKLGDDVITKAINEAVHAKIVRLIADTPSIIPADPDKEE